MNATAGVTSEVWSHATGMHGNRRQIRGDRASCDLDALIDAPPGTQGQNDALIKPSERRLPHLKRVVVPIDDTELSRAAVPIARLVARRLKVPVHLVGVIELQRLLPPALAYLAAVNQSLFRELLSTQMLEIRGRLEEIARQCKDDQIEVTYAILRGSLDRCIEQSTSVGDMVIMAVPGPPTSGRAHGATGCGSSSSAAPSILVIGPLRAPITSLVVEAESIGDGAPGEREPAGTVV